MNEQMERIGKQLLKTAELVSIVALAAVLGGVAFLWWRERSFTLPPGPAPGPMPMTAALPNPKFDRVAVEALTGKTDINEDERARRLVQLNMFDARSMEAARERDRQFAGAFSRAEQAFNAGRLDEAEQIVNTILQQYALHSGANALKRRIAAARVTPTPTPEAPVDPAAAGGIM